MRSVSPTRAFTEGWGLTLTLAALLSLASLLYLAVAGIGSDSVHALTRYTARCSLLLFSAASLASTLRRLWPNQATAWLLRNRRYVGVSFAASHTLHLACILTVLFVYPQSYEASLTTLVFGGVAYVFVAAMAATSSDAAVARLGRERWQRLHRTGIWYIHFIFAATLAPGMTLSPLYFAEGLVALAGPALRILGRRRPHAQR